VLGATGGEEAHSLSLGENGQHSHSHSHGQRWKLFPHQSGVAGGITFATAAGNNANVTASTTTDATVIGQRHGTQHRAAHHHPQLHHLHRRLNMLTISQDAFVAFGRTVVDRAIADYQQALADHASDESENRLRRRSHSSSAS
jgi:hypothetical protein